MDLRIVVLGGFGIVAVKLLGSALTAQNRPLRESIAVAITLLAVVGLDFALIPTLGGKGASIASAVGYTAGGIAMVVVFCITMKVGVRTLAPSRQTLRELWELATRLRGFLLGVSRSSSEQQRQA